MDIDGSLSNVSIKWVLGNVHIEGTSGNVGGGEFRIWWGVSNMVGSVGYGGGFGSGW